MTHLELTLATGRAALPRLVSTLHSRGWEIEHLSVVGGHGCVAVAGRIDAAQLAAQLGRLVEVRQVQLGGTCRVPRRPQPTRSVVVYQQRGCPPEPRVSRTAAVPAARRAAVGPGR